ncbi:MAG: hypothetical protein VYD54_10965, partial [Bdellovibrionota bacterium]|nr:hypothetical protein [Bdellovibrionota bacterium]
MKKILSVLLSFFYSFTAMGYNLDNLDIEGLWQLKGFPTDSKEKILFDFNLMKTQGADPNGFRLSYFENNKSIDRGISGVGLFVLPSCRSGRYNYFIRIDRMDQSFNLFEIVGTKGTPEVTMLMLKKSGGPSSYTFEKVP